MKARKVPGLDPAGSLADNLQRIVQVRCAELHGFMPAAADPTEVVALHDMRIAAKRLRYILEVGEHCFGPYAGQARKRAKALQDVIGEVHDCDVTIPRVQELAASAPSPAARVGLERLAQTLAARRDREFARFLELWEELLAEGFRARLEHAITRRPAVTSRSPDGNDPGVPSEGTP